jgi:hypothetical protein
MAALSHQLVPGTVDYTLGLEAPGPQGTGRFPGKRDFRTHPGFLCKANVSLQERGLRSGQKIQNLLSWAALALRKRLRAYMQEVSEFTTCCRL